MSPSPRFHPKDTRREGLAPEGKVAHALGRTPPTTSAAHAGGEARRVAACLGLMAFLAAAPAAELDPARPPGDNFDLRRWYLGTPDAGQSLSIPAAELAAGHTNQWFFTAPDGAMVFWAPVTGGTTSGSSFPRSELREQLNPPDNRINWSTRGTHVLEAACRVRRLPSTGKVILGQIHGYLGDARPLLKLMYNQGIPEAQCKLSPDEDAEVSLFFPASPLNSLITYRIEVEDGLLRVTVNGNQHAFHILASDPAWADQTFYFKAGAYVLDNAGTSAEGGRVDFYHLATVHTNHPADPPAIVTEPASISAPATSNVVLSVSATGGQPLHYQWHRDGVPIPGANLSYLSLRPVSPDDTGLYHASVSNASGSVTSAPARLNVLATNSSFTLAEALDDPLLAWSTAGSPPWMATHGAAQDGLDQAMAGPLPDDTAVTLQTTVTGPGQIRFWWRVSSQTNDDYLSFSLGGSTLARLSGTVPWQERAFAVPSGTQVLRWTYTKGEELAAGSDRAWLDGVSFRPDPPRITGHPAGRTLDAGGALVLSVSATGPGPLRYQWQCEGSNLLETASTRGTTNTTLTLSNCQPTQSGAYRVLVRNAGGEVASSNALVSISPTLPLPDAVDAPQLAWSTSGSLPWVGQFAASHDGVDAARSGRIGHSQSCTLQVTVQGPGMLRFWWKTSCEPVNDRLVLTRNGSEVARLSGESDWQPRSLSLPSGSHILRWIYSKNSSTVQGRDAAWIDAIDYAPLLPPAAPDHFAATPISLGAIRLDWTDPAGQESGFLLERSTNGTFFVPVAHLASNTVSLLHTGLLAETTYHFRLRATNAAGASAPAGPLAASTPPFTVARLNFQPASALIPPGHLVEAGHAYAARGNGLVHGWNSSRTSSAIDRNSTLSPDQRHDTFISSGSSTSTRWELAVPPGDYHVLLVAGDPSSSSGTQRLSVEGMPALVGSLTATQRWISNHVIVPVRDGRLSISNLPGSSNNKLCFLEITRLTPLLDGAADFTAEAGQPWSFTPPTPRADPCGTGPVTVLVADTLTNGIAPCPGPLRFTRTWVAHDSCGRSQSATQTVTVVDATPPVFLAASTHLCDPGLPALPPVTDQSGLAPTVVCQRSDGQPANAPFAPGTHRLACTAQDACGNSATQDFQVVVEEPLAALGPEPQTIAAGDTLTLAVAPAAGTVLAQQWHVAGAPLPGATNLVLSLPNITPQQAGTYCLTLTGPCGQLTVCAAVVVLPPPAPPPSPPPQP
ncbi:MAG: hypothetical protein RJA22_1727 [Verrucomicrobiota bacterium]